MTSQSRFMALSGQELAKRDLAEYGVARFRDVIFDAVLTLWRRRQSEGWTQRRIANLINRDPAWVSRNLSAPANWTLRTAGELIQALEGEAEVRIEALDDPLQSLENFDAYDGYSLERKGLPDINSAGTFPLPRGGISVPGLPL